MVTINIQLLHLVNLFYLRQDVKPLKVLPINNNDDDTSKLSESQAGAGSVQKSEAEFIVPDWGDKKSQLRRRVVVAARQPM
jgi:hypothetical protein